MVTFLITPHLFALQKTRVVSINNCSLYKYYTIELLIPLNIKLNIMESSRLCIHLHNVYIFLKIDMDKIIYLQHRTKKTI